MHKLAVTVPLLVVVLGSQMSPVARADDPAQVLKRKGLKRDKGKYTLAAEEDVWRSRIQALTDLDAADAAVAEAGAAAARIQAIIAYRNRIALDGGIFAEMRVMRRDGTTAEEQALSRGARRDRTVAKQERTRQGLAGKRENPREAKRLEGIAVEACRKSRESWDSFVEQVRQVDDHYKTLANDSEVREALGKSRFAPSDGFKKLVFSLGVRKKGANRGPATSLAEPPKQVTRAIAELESAPGILRDVPFRKNTKGFADRDKRRNDTIAAIEAAITKLKQGETDPETLDKATELHDGYRGPSSPAVRTQLGEAGKHLKKAVELLRGDPAE
jgi:hypothetical protein